MAITKLLRIKESKTGKMSDGLKRNLFYICDAKKTQDGVLIGGTAGIDAAGALQTMLINKEMWGKTDQTQAFHYILSFDPSVKTDTDTAAVVAREFCEKLFGDHFLYLYAIHDDKDHLHVHITFDSVSRIDGHKFHSPKGDWAARIQPITDGLCEKYHLPTLSYDEDKRGVPYNEWQHRQEVRSGSNGEIYFWYDIIRDDIDDAIMETDMYDAFLQNMRNRRYVVRDGKYLSLRPVEKPKAVRSGRLGRGYGKEEIIYRIDHKLTSDQISRAYKTYGDEQQMKAIIFYKVQRCGRWHMTPYQRSFYKRWRRTHLIRRPGYPYAWRYRRDILELKRISDSIIYMLDHDIGDERAVDKRERFLKEELESVQAQKVALSSKLYRSEKYKLVRRINKASREEDEDQYALVNTDVLAAVNRLGGIAEYEHAAAEYESLREELKGLSYSVKDIFSQLKVLQGIREIYAQEEHPREEPGRVNDIRKERKAEEFHPELMGGGQKTEMHRTSEKRKPTSQDKNERASRSAIPGFGNNVTANAGDIKREAELDRT